MLGIQRLKTLGPITTNYDSVTMQFSWLDNTIYLQGLHDNDIKETLSCQLKGMQDTKSIYAFYHLRLSSSNQNTIPNFSTASSILTPLMHCFSHLF